MEHTDDRPCEICRHYQTDDKGNYACEKWECEYKDRTPSQTSVNTPKRNEKQADEEIINEYFNRP